MNRLRLILSLLLCGHLSAFAVDDNTNARQTNTGYLIGGSATSKLGFYGATRVVRPSGTNQRAITDSTGGTPAATLAATTGIQTVIIPVSSLATGLSTSAMDLLTNYTPGYAFELLKFDFVTTIAGTGAGASQTFNLEIGTTNVTGGVVNTTLASTATVGSITAGTTITAANTGTASDTISIEMAAGGTVFSAGSGYFVLKLRNLDTVNAISSVAAQSAALRTALVDLGLIKGSN